MMNWTKFNSKLRGYKIEGKITKIIHCYSNGILSIIYNFNDKETLYLKGKCSLHPGDFINHMKMLNNNTIERIELLSFSEYDSLKYSVNFYCPRNPILGFVIEDLELSLPEIKVDVKI